MQSLRDLDGRRPLQKLATEEYSLDEIDQNLDAAAAMLSKNDYGTYLTDLLRDEIP
jgi:hypothetical protein